MFDPLNRENNTPWKFPRLQYIICSLHNIAEMLLKLALDNESISQFGENKHLAWLLDLGISIPIIITILNISIFFSAP